jgi:transposase, IS30 family
MAGAPLSAHEREEIRVGCDRDESFTDIAAALGRATSTVANEVNRNGGRLGYCAVHAGERADGQRARPKATKLQTNSALAAHVQAKLLQLDSPTTIAVELARAGGVDGDTVSPETIYQAVYAHGWKGLPSGLHDCLHRQRRRRKRRQPAGAATPGPLKAFSLIHLRPAAATDRAEPGHWEGDLIIGERNASAVVTLVERTTRVNMLGKLPYGSNADGVRACLRTLFRRVPAELRRTLTWDQGSEMARHVELAADLDLDIYFADPHHPWQRGSNENFNGLARRYLGKGTDLSVHSQLGLDAVSWRINTMPRRLFGWDSAADRYAAAVVATTA